MAKKIWGGKKISEILKDAENKQERINSLFGELQETASKIKNVSDEIDQVSKTTSISATNVENVLSEVRGSRDEIQKLRGGVTQLQSSTEELINANKNLLDEAKEQLAVIAGGSLSNTFEKRRDILSSSAKKWFNWLLIDVLFLIIVAAIVFSELKGSSGLTTSFFLKFSLSFPFIYLAFFFHGQYSRERELEEEYAFKSAVSFSFDAYRKILVEEINYEKSDEKMKLLDFVIDTIKNIYSPIMKNTHSKKDSGESNSTLEKINKIVDNIVGLVKH